MIPCSYWALTWVAVLPTCMTSYEISVRQTRDLPVSWYIPHIQLPSDSTSRWTCCSAIHFPLSGRVRDLHPLERAHGAQTKKRTGIHHLFFYRRYHHSHTLCNLSTFCKNYFLQSPRWHHRQQIFAYTTLIDRFTSLRTTMHNFMVVKEPTYKI